MGIPLLKKNNNQELLMLMEKPKGIFSSFPKLHAYLLMGHMPHKDYTKSSPLHKKLVNQNIIPLLKSFFSPIPEIFHSRNNEKQTLNQHFPLYCCKFQASTPLQQP